MSETILKRLQLLLGRAKVILGSQKTAQVELLKGEVLNLEKLEPFGFSSNKKTGEAFCVFPSGDRANGAVLFVLGSPSFELKEGEVAVYNEKGAKVLLKNDGTIVIDGDCEFKGNLKITGKLEVTDEISSNADVKAGGISFKNHAHPFSNADGVPSNTQPPSGA